MGSKMMEEGTMMMLWVWSTATNQEDQRELRDYVVPTKRTNDVLVQSRDCCFPDTLLEKELATFKQEHASVLEEMAQVKTLIGCLWQHSWKKERDAMDVALLRWCVFTSGSRSRGLDKKARCSTTTRVVRS
jgi:hypothetical protein